MAKGWSLTLLKHFNYLVYHEGHKTAPWTPRSIFESSSNSSLLPLGAPPCRFLNYLVQVSTIPRQVARKQPKQFQPCTASYTRCIQSPRQKVNGSTRTCSTLVHHEGLILKACNGFFNLSKAPKCDLLKNAFNFLRTRPIVRFNTQNSTMFDN